jgi:DNA-binding NarL/FixJ family response regulator
MDAATRTIRILVCDDHEIFAQSLAFTLDAEKDLQVCSTNTDVASAKTGFAECRPDVAIVDVRMNGEDGLTLVSWITEHHPHCRTIVLTAFDSDDALIRAYETGAVAFTVKSTSCDHLISLIRDVAGGSRLIREDHVDLAKERVSSRRTQSFDALSASDQRLIDLIAQGLPDRQIAAEMHLSLQTIRNRVSRLLHTFQLSNRTQLAVLAAQTNSGEG